MTDALSPAVILAVIAGMGLVNFGLRVLPLALLSRLHLPRPILRWLSYVPISVMGALVTSEVLRPGGEWRAPSTSPYLWAALLTAFAFRISRSFVGATVSGIVAFVVLRAVL